MTIYLSGCDALNRLQYGCCPSVSPSVSRRVSVRAILIWNRLPAALVRENNLSVFKSMLQTFDFSYTLLGRL